MIQFSLAISDYRLLPLFKKNFLIITSIHQDVVFPIIFCKINHPTCFGMKPTLITGYNIQASANIYPVLPNPCFSQMFNRCSFYTFVFFQLDVLKTILISTEFTAFATKKTRIVCTTRERTNIRLDCIFQIIVFMMCFANFFVKRFLFFT